MDDYDKTAANRAAGQCLFDRYTLIRELGRGGMGIVWLARDEKLERDVALKFLPETVSRDPNAVDDLKRETRRALELTHSNIVRIHDFVDDAHSAAIAMEYVDGASLAKLARGRPDRICTLREIEGWLQELCEALDYAHIRAKVVHRDLKPANLMVDGQGHLKITDFGISAPLTDSTTKVSKAPRTLGTLVYMSPQHLMGRRPAATDDIYSLGATLYELLTGKPPFYTGLIDLQVQKSVAPSVAERRVELGVGGEPVPATWEKTIAACLAKEPADRPQSAGEVRERLARKGLKGGKAKGPKPVAADAGGSASAKMTKEWPAPPPTTKSTDRKSARVWWISVAIAAVAGLGYYFGEYAWEQQQIELTRTRAAQLAAARSGLVVRTQPTGATITVGGLSGQTTPATFKQLRLGNYKVVLSKPGYETQLLRLTVEENKITEPPSIVLKPSVGGMALTAEPAGVDYELISDKLTATELPSVRKTGKTPASLTGLPIGVYTVTYRRQQWPEQTSSVEVKPGETAAASGDFVGGGIRLTTEPGGAAWRVDHAPTGAKLAVTNGRTPQEFKELPAGGYTVTFNREGGWLPQVCQFEIVKGKTVYASAKFPTGELKLMTEPAGLSYVIKGGPDGRRNSTGNTPADVSLPIGKYEVTFVREGGWARVQRTVEVSAEKAATASAGFPPGKVDLSSTPPGAEVWWGGQHMSETPYTLGAAPPGRYDYELKLKGYKTASASLTVQPGETAQKSVALEKPFFMNGANATLPGLNLTMVWIAPGTFTMGSEHGNADEKPVHEVKLTRGYWLGATELTQGQWEAVMGSTVREQRDRISMRWPLDGEGPDFPMYYVSWKEAMEYCRKLTKREQAAGRLPEGYEYTLPTEAQWENACRAGTTGEYAGEMDVLSWYYPSSGYQTHPVGQKSANAWGLYDMEGNVWELCLDCYGSYPAGSVTDPKAPALGSNCIARGGSSQDAKRSCRSAVRLRWWYDTPAPILGFRLALSSIP